MFSEFFACFGADFASNPAKSVFGSQGYADKLRQNGVKRWRFYDLALIRVQNGANFGVFINKIQIFAIIFHLLDFTAYLC